MSVITARSGVDLTTLCRWRGSEGRGRPRPFAGTSCNSVTCRLFDGAAAVTTWTIGAVSPAPRTPAATPIVRQRPDLRVHATLFSREFSSTKARSTRSRWRDCRSRSTLPFARLREAQPARLSLCSEYDSGGRHRDTTSAGHGELFALRAASGSSFRGCMRFGNGTNGRGVANRPPSDLRQAPGRNHRARPPDCNGASAPKCCTANQTRRTGNDPSGDGSDPKRCDRSSHRFGPLVCQLLTAERISRPGWFCSPFAQYPEFLTVGSVRPASYEDPAPPPP